MELALYHEDYGYYSDPSRPRTGAAGDFATNASVGEAFGRLLALRFYRFWQEHGAPTPVHLLELGPEDGSVALDLLRAARALSPDFHGALRYTAGEISARKRAALARRFAEAEEPHLVVLEPPTGPLGEFGVVFGNEVLDALPVRLVRWSKHRWRELRVGLRGDHLAWIEAPIRNSLLAERAAALGSAFPERYQTELCLRTDQFFHDLVPVIDRGLFLFIDYGFPADDYYHPRRTAGTLQTYAGHQSNHHPLDSPGSRDLTAHVDFTATTAAARRAG
nr:SAM-dependent methyltransferase [Akkermansiaceae bacterium]